MFGNSKSLEDGQDILTRTLTPPTGAEVICFYGAKNAKGIANLGMYIMRNASLSTEE